MKYDKNILQNIQASDDRIPKRIYKDEPLTIEKLKGINQKYIGGGMSQNYFAIPWFEYYFDNHKFQYMVEFGSQKGRLSTYFANYAGVCEDMFFDTYEINPDKDWKNRTLEGCGHWFEKLADISPYINYFHDNVFSESTMRHVSENISQFKSLIFCDGGDKAREFNTYAQFCKVGDCMIVHDWNVELKIENISHAVQQYGFEKDEPFASSSDNLGIWLMPFIKTK